MCQVIRVVYLAAVSSCLMACSDFQDRFNGYPKEDTVINVESATSNEIADALSHLSRITVAGDDWEFLDPDDLCTVHVIDQAAKQTWPLKLLGARFAVHRDSHTHHYYAIMKHGDVPALGADGQPLRLFEADTYHNVFFAEGYLQALAHKCAQSQLQLQASSALPHAAKTRNQ
ncbi:MAG: hypothetical protein KBT18_04050 [Comamonas sp.]|nr:hypothetical protein [Candidatus Comamonas equi]